MNIDITLPAFEKWARSNRALAASVIAARASAQSERARVDAYLQPIFDTFTFVTEEGQRVTTPRDLYLCDLDNVAQEKTIQEFYEKALDAHAANGFTGQRGSCPALIAESALIVAEHELIESACKLVGVKASLIYGERREAMLKLLLSACLANEVRAA